jgi:hypothetical protein
MWSPREALVLMVALVAMYALWWAAGVYDPAPPPSQPVVQAGESTGWCERDGVRVDAWGGVCP